MKKMWLFLYYGYEFLGSSVFCLSLFQSGPDLTTEETWGVNYRALRDLFQISKTRMNIIEYEVGVQMIEIYNEQVRDLLVIDGSNRRYPLRIYFCKQLISIYHAYSQLQGIMNITIVC